MACKKWGMKVKAAKCKVLSNENDSIAIDGNQVETVDKFIFLGSIVPNTSDDIVRRIALATVAFGKLKHKIWSNNDLPVYVKTRLFYALIIPIALYACETWTLKNTHMQKLSVFLNNCLRTMAGKRRIDCTKIANLKMSLGVETDILDMVKKRGMNWFEHVSRRDISTSYVKKSYKRNFTSKRPRGRPPKRWSANSRTESAR